jgi:O-antigen ligase
MSNLTEDLPLKHVSGRLIAIIAAAVLAVVGVGIGTESWWLAGLPFGLALVWVTIIHFKSIYFLLMASIPLSTEMELPGGFGTDFFSEPLMWLLTLAGGLWLIRHGSRVDGRFLRHPITLVLLVHLVWTAITVIFSEDFGVSFKFFLAKGWYVAVFFFLTGRFLGKEEDIKKMIWWFFIPLVLTVLIILFRHSGKGFSFETINSVLSPFYRNHVMYACIMAVFIPFIWYATYWYNRWSLLWWILVAGIIVLLVGINFAYTRAAYGALVASVVVSIVVKLRAMRLALLFTTLLFGLFIAFVSYKDNWLLFAPDYERTVTHTRFESLLEATTRLEDISLMERVYRWVAASQMIKEKPFMGFGPGNFYFFYKNYTVNSFRTYVSDNPERSGMHNYYLMIAVEQGLPGVFLFIGLCFFTMIQGQRIYKAQQDLWKRRMALAALLCFVLIIVLMLMNDLVETDKIGSLFFISLAILVNMDINARNVSTGSDNLPD